jgi:hypothetical protein
MGPLWHGHINGLCRPILRAAPSRHKGKIIVSGWPIELDGPWRPTSLLEDGAAGGAERLGGQQEDKRLEGGWSSGWRSRCMREEGWSAGETPKWWFVERRGRVGGWSEGWRGEVGGWKWRPAAWLRGVGRIVEPWVRPAGRRVAATFEW